jgi:hypothetical protein
MPDSIEAPEQQTNIIPIRQSYFNRRFWTFWSHLKERQKAAYILGWISELETAIRRLSERVRRIEDHLEDDRK